VVDGDHWGAGPGVEAGQPLLGLGGVVGHGVGVDELGGAARKLALPDHLQDQGVQFGEGGGGHGGGVALAGGDGRDVHAFGLGGAGGGLFGFGVPVVQGGPFRMVGRGRPVGGPAVGLEEVGAGVDDFDVVGDGDGDGALAGIPEPDEGEGEVEAFTVVDVDDGEADGDPVVEADEEVVGVQLLGGDGLVVREVGRVDVGENLHLHLHFFLLNF